MDLLTEERSIWKDQLKDYLGQESGLLHADAFLDTHKKIESLSTSTNFLYTLYLLRTKERSSIEKALKEVDHLLYFQLQEGLYKGNFPAFLHEYPHCERPFEMVDCLFSIYWIYRDFQNIMDKSLKDRLIKCIHAALEPLKARLVSERYSYRIKVQIAALFAAFGSLLDQLEYIDLAESQLSLLSQEDPKALWGSPRELSRLLYALALLDKKQLSQWSSLLQFIDQAWDTEYPVYRGPALKEFFDESEQEWTLAHQFCLLKQGKKLIKKASVLTKLKLEYFVESPLLSYQAGPIEVKQLDQISWVNQSASQYLLSYFNIPHDQWVKTGGFYPLKLIIKGRDQKVDYFLLQMGTFVEIELIGEEQWQLTYHCQKDQEPEIDFFWNLSSDAKVSIEGHQATMFEAQKECIIDFKTIKVSLKLVNEKLNVWGQILHKNRRTQLQDNLLKSYDKHLYYRLAEPFEGPLKFELKIISASK